MWYVIGWFHCSLVSNKQICMPANSTRHNVGPPHRPRLFLFLFKRDIFLPARLPLQFILQAKCISLSWHWPGILHSLQFFLLTESSRLFNLEDLGAYTSTDLFTRTPTISKICDKYYNDIVSLDRCIYVFILVSSKQTVLCTPPNRKK